MFNQFVSAGVHALKAQGTLGFSRAQAPMFEHYIRPSFNVGDFRIRTNRARNPLQNTHDLLCYNAFYSSRHFAAIKHLFGLLPQRDSHAKSSTSLKIIDYGCGQGLATLALLECLFHTYIDLDIHLVEPSPMALDAAHLYVRGLCSQLRGKAYVHKHRLSLDCLPDVALHCYPKKATLHLFSNVLDMTNTSYFDLEVLLKQIRKVPGRHWILATSPCYPQAQMAFNQVKQFFDGAQTYADHEAIVPLPRHNGYVSMYQGRRTPRSVKGYMLALSMDNHI